MKVFTGELFKHRHFYIIMLLLVLLIGLTLRYEQRGADGREYLRWTHSLVFDQDIHLLNNVAAVGGSYSLTPTGYVFERVNVGAPLLWAPFYGLAAFFLPAEGGEPYPADGPVQILWLNFSSWLYPVLGGILTIGALRHLFSGRTLAAALAAILFGTPVLFYMVTFPMSAHPASIFLAGLLLYVWLPGGSRSDGEQNRTAFFRYFAVGLVNGWLMTVASYNVVFFVLPGFDLLRNLRHTKNWRGLLRNGLATGLGGLVGFAPQMIVWEFLFGSPLYSPYSGQLLWTEPYFLETLFSTFHGLFFYAPVLLLAGTGLWVWRSKDPWTAASVGLTWLLLAYIVSINVAWWAGSSFGNRYFLTLSPFFVFGLSAFIQTIKKWAAAFILPCALWTIGLYLQYLDGVGVTSDSVVYSAAELARGQFAAFSRVHDLLPQLLIERPWFLVPAAILPVFGLILVVAGRFVYSWAIAGDRASVSRKLQVALAIAGGLLVLFLFWAGFKGQQAKAALVDQGFYQEPHQVVRREVKELAGKAGLVTRAMYHQQIGQPDNAAADLKRASQIWKRETAANPQRLYLGQKAGLKLDGAASLHLNYPGPVRLIGYKIYEPKAGSIEGELFWEKLEGEESRAVVRPIIRVFDPAGALLGSTILDFPFPAHYIPAGGVFKDSFSAYYTKPADTWVWLGVSLEEFLRLPVNANGEQESDIIASVNHKAFPPAPFIADENGVDLVGKPTLVSQSNYQVGQRIPLQVTWQRSGEDADGRLVVSLLNAGEDPVAQQEYTLPEAKAGLMNRTYCLAVPQNSPAGPYRLRAEVHSTGAGYFLVSGGGLVESFSYPVSIVMTNAGPRPNICNLLEANFARRYEPLTPQQRLDTLLTEQIRLAGYDLLIVPQPTSLLAKVVLYWYVEDSVENDYLLSLQLLDSSGQAHINYTGDLIHGSRPTSTWLEGEWILDEHPVEVPLLAPGSYQLRIALLDKQTGKPAPDDPNQTGVTLQTLQIP